ncbi:outer membrane beta-barrel protein [Rhizobium sp. CG5]|nr:outer membrane beta-barrel protein [Rhizobium sp. CG5]
MPSKTGRKMARPPHRTSVLCALAAGLLWLPPLSGLAQTLPASSDSLTSGTTSSDDDAITADTTDDLQTGTTVTAATVATTTLDPDAEIAADALDNGRQNLRESTIDQLRGGRDLTDDGTGIRLGTMMLKPTISQGLVTETTKTGNQSERKTYWDTGLKGTLTSDWSSHQLTVNGQGNWRRVLSGDGEDEPTAAIDADLRLDLADGMAARLTAAYSFSHEDTDDPNAISGASEQSGIHQFNTGAALERDFGKIRGSVGLNFGRTLYTDAVLSDGTRVELSDRNRSSATLNARIGYELSPALIPFIEVSAGRILYDDKRDSSGYQRSGDLYAVSTGLAADFGEKLRGELGIGYERMMFDDQRLEDLGAITLDGNLGWSPQRGTDVTVGLSTSIEPSTTAGLSGSVAYQLNAGVAHELRSNLVARLSGSTTWRDYPTQSDDSDTIYYTAGTGLTYSVNRYVDLTADLSYELTTTQTSADTQVLRAGVGMALKR